MGEDQDPQIRALDVDLSKPDFDIDSDTVPAHLLEGGYRPTRADAKGVWVVRGDGHLKLVPWSEIKPPSTWGLL